MTIEHAVITDPYIHEPKGAFAAAADKVYVSNGAGSGTWKKVTTSQMDSGAAASGQVLVSNGSGGYRFETPYHGSVYFVNIAAPYTLTYPATYTKAAPTTTASGHGRGFTEATNARLTYTGTQSIDADVVIGISLDQTAGANRNIRAAIFKNGVIVPASECIQTVQNTVIGQMGVHADLQLTTNDYLEIYLQNDGATGDIRVYSFGISVKVTGET